MNTETPHISWCPRTGCSAIGNSTIYCINQFRKVTTLLTIWHQVESRQQNSALFRLSSLVFCYMCLYVPCVVCFFFLSILMVGNKMSSAPSAQISLGIRPVWSDFAVHMKKICVLSYALSAQRRFWSAADLSLRWTHMSFCWFVMLCFSIVKYGRMKYVYERYYNKQH